MDRIGVIKDSARLQARRLILSAPVPFWRMARFLILIFGLCCFLLGFSIGQARADTIPATQNASWSISNFCGPNFTYTGPWTGLGPALQTFANVTYGPNICGTSNGSLSAVVTLSPPTIKYTFATSGANATYSYTLLSTYTCPSGYTLNGTNCDSTAPPPTCPTGYVLDASGVCVASGSGSAALTVAQAAALDWLIANQSALQSNLTASTQVFDSTVGAAFWSFGFVGVMILYFSSHVIGLVLKKVRNG